MSMPDALSRNACNERLEPGRLNRNAHSQDQGARQPHGHYSLGLYGSQVCIRKLSVPVEHWFISLKHSADSSSLTT